MGGSIKPLLAARKARDNKRGGKLLDFTTNIPPLKPGKGRPRSSKSSVPANRNSNTNKKGKVSKKTGVNNPNQIVCSSKRSSRLNYAKLRGK